LLCAVSRELRSTAFQPSRNRSREPFFDEAIDLFLNARRAGLTIRSGVDCLIAACAIRNDAMIVHVDRDFTKLAQVSPLQVHLLSE
jgi:predicted nucleic acid-binding protein